VSADNVSVPIVVPAPVLEGLEAVRASGKTNMFDRHAVARLAMDAGYYATALWVTEHRATYAAGIFAGFVAEGATP
jgi:hypothetical protein